MRRGYDSDRGCEMMLAARERVSTRRAYQLRVNMGHIRIGTLPASRRRKDVIGLVAEGSGVVRGAGAVTHAREQAFNTVRDDDAGFREPYGGCDPAAYDRLSLRKRGKCLATMKCQLTTPLTYKPAL